jgi:hypothetical protein
VSDNWNDGLGIDREQATRFGELAASLGSTPTDLIRLMVDRVLEADRQLGAYGLGPIARWRTSTEAQGMITEVALSGLPLDIRPTSFMWPNNKVFPWSASECQAAVLGYQVRWHGTFDDFTNHLRGLWELVDGYAVLHQP